MNRIAKLSLVHFGIFCCFEALRGAHAMSEVQPVKDGNPPKINASLKHPVINISNSSVADIVIC